MNQFVINLVGVVFYLITSTNGINNARQVYLVDASNGVTYGGQTVAPHVSYIVVDTASLVSNGTTWDADGTFTVSSKPYSFFKLTGETLTVNAEQTRNGSGQPVLDTTAQDTGVPRVTTYCPGWTPDLAHTQIAGRLDITTGQLASAGNLADNQGVTSSWKFNVAGDLVITGTKNGAAQTIKVAPGGEVEIGVATDDVMRRNLVAQSDPTNHFLLFYSMGHPPSGVCDVNLYPGSHAHADHLRPADTRMAAVRSPYLLVSSHPAKSKNAPKTTSRQKDPVKPRKPSRNLHADCSNSAYP